MLAKRPFLLSLFFLLPVAALACSSSSSSSGSGSDASTTAPCNENPWECPSSQTCWPASATAFECLNAGPGMLGSTCANDVGSPTCGPGLACFQAIGASTGSCLAYCSTVQVAHACTGQDTCQGVELGGSGGPTFYVCVPTGNPDSGTPSDSGTPAGDTGAGDAVAGD